MVARLGIDEAIPLSNFAMPAGSIGPLPVGQLPPIHPAAIPTLPLPPHPTGLPVYGLPNPPAPQPQPQPIGSPPPTGSGAPCQFVQASLNPAYNPTSPIPTAAWATWNYLGPGSPAIYIMQPAGIAPAPTAFGPVVSLGTFATGQQAENAALGWIESHIPAGAATNIPATLVCSGQPTPPPPPPQPPPPPPGGMTCISICNWPPGLLAPPAPPAPPSPPPPLSPPPTSPPPLAPPTPGTPTQPWIDKPSGTIVLPLPSDPQFPQLLEDSLAVINDFGEALYLWIDGQLESLQIWLKDNTPSFDPNCGFSDFQACLNNILYPPIAWFLEQSDNAIGIVRTALYAVTHSSLANAGCDVKLMGAISIIKLAWGAFKKTQFGSNTWLLLQGAFDVELNVIDRTIKYIEESLCPLGLPTLPETMACYLADTVPAANVKFIGRVHGLHEKFTQALADAERERLRTDEIIEYQRRQSLGNVDQWYPDSPYAANEVQTEKDWYDASVKQMRGRGWIHVEDAAQYYQVWDELPTIADHLHWLARNIDDIDYVANYHLLDGFTSPAGVASILGEAYTGTLPQSLTRDFWGTFGAELRAQGMRKIDAARHYAAHWLHGSPGQMREFAWRLRPGRPLKDWESVISASLGEPTNPGAPAPLSMTFTTADYQKLLSEQDYGYRDVGWFASTLYHVPALSYLRDMFRYGVISADDLQGYHLDLGYSPQDSERFVSVDVPIKNRIRQSEAYGWNPSTLSTAYSLGMISADEDAQWMEYLGFNKDEINAHQNASQYRLRGSIVRRAVSYSLSRTLNQVLAAYEVGSVDAKAATDTLENLSIQPAISEAMLAAIDMKRLTSTYKQTINAVKKGYLSGRITADQANNLLTNSGLVQNVVSTYIGAWAVQRLATEQAPTKADIKRYLKEGLITPEQASNQLQQLGVSASAIQLLLDETQYLSQQAEQKAEAAAEKRKAAQELKEYLANQRTMQKEAADEARVQIAQIKATEKEEAALLRQEEKAQALAYREQVAAARAAALAAKRESATLVRAAKEAEQAKARLVAALRKDEPPATLAKWAGLGLIDHSYFATRMQLYGYSPDSIDRQWRAACAKSTANCIDDGTGIPGVGTAADASSAAAAATATEQQLWGPVELAEQSALGSGGA